MKHNVSYVEKYECYINFKQKVYEKNINKQSSVIILEKCCLMITKLSWTLFYSFKCSIGDVTLGRSLG